MTAARGIGWARGIGFILGVSLAVVRRDAVGRLADVAGREGWWFAYKLAYDALVPEERVAHLVLWHDGESFHALSADEADAFAALPAEESRGGPRGATLPVGAAQ